VSRVEIWFLRAFLAAAAIMLGMQAAVALSATYYSNPSVDDGDGDGSVGDPWGKLQWIMENQYGTLAGGDTIILKDGYHGKLGGDATFNRESHTDYIYIQAENIHGASLGYVVHHSTEPDVTDGFQFWDFNGIVIDPCLGGYAGRSAFRVTKRTDDQHVGYLGFHNCVFRCLDDVNGFTSSDWEKIWYVSGSAQYAITIDANEGPVYIEDCVFQNTTDGVSLTVKDDLTILRTDLSYFCRDAFAGFGGPGRTLVEDCNAGCCMYSTGGLHRDMVDCAGGSYAGTPAVLSNYEFRRVTWWSDGNGALFLPWGNPDSNADCKDVNWIFENCIMEVSGSSGTRLYDPCQCYFINNIIVPSYSRLGSNPTLSANISSYDGNSAPAADNVVRNNIATAIPESGAWTTSNNIDVTDYDDFNDLFTDYPNRDYTIKDQSAASFNAGTVTDAPLTDLLGNPRVEATDIGAYELQYTPAAEGDHRRIIITLSGGE